MMINYIFLFFQNLISSKSRIFKEQEDIDFKKFRIQSLLCSLMMFFVCPSASASPLLQVSSVGNMIKVGINIPHHTYSNVGIKINTPGYALGETSQVCKPHQNGYCLFSINDVVHSQFEINGPSGKASISVCLNGVGKISCQNYDVTIQKLHLSFITNPSNTTPMGTTTGTITPSVQVGIFDDNNQAVMNNGVPIALHVSYQPNTGVYQGILAGKTTVATMSGVADFTDLSVTQIGTGYTIIASAAGITSAISQPFDVTASTAGYTYRGDEAIGYEITYIGNLGSQYQGTSSVYVDYGDNPIDAEGFEHFSETGYIKNTPRNSIFNYSNLLGSPSAPPGPLLISEIGGYTWGAIVDTQIFDWPFDPNNYPPPEPVSGWEAGALSPEVPDGVFKYSNINKNQLLIFTVNDQFGAPILRYFIKDPWGGTYMMDATDAVTVEETTAAFEAAVLPLGWTKYMDYLTQDLYVNPAYGGVKNYYASVLKLRDSANNSYLQLLWAPGGETLAAQIGSPMPIWAGSAGGRLNGLSNMDDNLFGSIGDDLFYPGTGNGTIDGGNGYNGVFFEGTLSQYTMTRSGNAVYLTSSSGTKILMNVQYLKFSDGFVVFF